MNNIKPLVRWKKELNPYRNQRTVLSKLLIEKSTKDCGRGVWQKFSIDEVDDILVSIVTEIEQKTTDLQKYIPAEQEVDISKDTKDSSNVTDKKIEELARNIEGRFNEKRLDLNSQTLSKKIIMQFKKALIIAGYEQGWNEAITNISIDELLEMTSVCLNSLEETPITLAVLQSSAKKSDNSATFTVLPTQQQVYQDSSKTQLQQSDRVILLLR